jgi:exopolyphosphatase/guanosine-5'-triphosphate,3'-diphosphate pyrophosphatase
MGAVRLLQVLDEKKHAGERFGQLVREYVDAAHKRITREIGDRRIDLCVGTGGNIESIADLKREPPGKDRAGVLTRADLDHLLRRIQGLTYEQRIQELRLRPDRADVILPAAIVLQKVLRLSGAEELLVPGVGLKDGLLADMVEELYGDRKPLRRTQVMASALALGRKFGFDEQHGSATAGFAVKLFDELRGLHNLSLDYRLLLEVAALLHDIGQVINIADHHKHTHYLLMAAPVVGLTQEQTAIVANVARYHRKSAPKPQHEPYAMLPPRDRVAVTKLAALLRLADAMDNEHASRVTDFTVEYRRPRVTVRLQGAGDLLLERWALAKKSALFEQVYSVKFAVEE